MVAIRQLHQGIVVVLVGVEDAPDGQTKVPPYVFMAGVRHFHGAVRPAGVNLYARLLQQGKGRNGRVSALFALIELFRFIEPNPFKPYLAAGLRLHEICHLVA